MVVKRVAPLVTAVATVVSMVAYEGEPESLAWAKLSAVETELGSKVERLYILEAAPTAHPVKAMGCHWEATIAADPVVPV